MTPVEAVVCFKWQTKGYRSTFGPDTVNVLKNMVRRHYPRTPRIICVTDNPKGLDPEIETVPLWSDFADIPSPHGARNPSCYRRLKVFSPEARAWFKAERFAVIDLDTVIMGDLTPLWERSEDFVIWGETNPKSYYNGSMMLMTAGARQKVLQTFDPKTSPRQAMVAGKFGSDQGWISHCLGPGEATWRTTDGVYSYNVHLRRTGQSLPADARMVMFHGAIDPWSPAGMAMDWVKEHWR